MLLYVIFILFNARFCLSEGQSATPPDHFSEIPKGQISESGQSEAVAIRKEARALKKGYEEEAKEKALEAKALVLKTLTDTYKNKAYAPCGKNKGLRCTFQKGERQKPSSSLSPSPSPSLREPTHAHQILVFVSFSMPEESLKSLSRDLEQNPDVKLVLRGLIDDSMEKTARRLQGLGSVMEINPELFEAYQISHVPTFVWVRCCVRRQLFF